MPWGKWNPGDDPPVIAIAVTSPDGHNTHVGIAYQTEDGVDRMNLLHLAFHCRLEVEAPFDPAVNGYVCLIPNLPNAMLEVVAARCRSAARSLPELRYGFLDQRDAHIDADGNYFVLDDRGLNCSTFVLMVFRSVKVELVQEETWPQRADDEHRFRELWCVLLDYVRRKYAHDPALRRRHEDYVRKIGPDVTAIRIRPEETAGACSSETLPVAFRECERHGIALLRLLGIPVPT